MHWESQMQNSWEHSPSLQSVKLPLEESTFMASHIPHARTSEVICHSPLELGTPGYSFKIWLDWIELACGLWVSLWCLTSPFQILQTAGQSMSIFIIFMAGFLQFRLRRHRLTKHYLQPGHCGLGSLLGQAETQWLGVDAGMTRGCFADVLAIADPKHSKTNGMWGIVGAHGGIRYPDGTTSTKVQRLSCLSKSKLWPHPLVEEIGAPDRLAEYRLSTPLGCRSRIFSDF